MARVGEALLSVAELAAFFGVPVATITDGATSAKDPSATASDATSSSALTTSSSGSKCNEIPT